MRKFKLEMESLEVESFATSSATGRHGTVLGNEMPGGSSIVPATMPSNVVTCDSCDGPQCNQPTRFTHCDDCA
ncbi:MAG TPA: hypothetical protein VE913_04520 [Longimicrobium sp.]|nr:hypothetical protein [Longimicrobium sp.]